jgi:hypothetical protein
MRSGEQELKGAARGEVAEALQKERGMRRGGSQVTEGGVREGASEAAVEDQQQVTAGQVTEGLA